jgi:hypothetical protein
MTNSIKSVKSPIFRIIFRGSSNLQSLIQLVWKLKSNTVIISIFFSLSVSSFNILCSYHSAHTEWQCPISGAHSIMMDKSAHADECGWCKPTHFSLYLLSCTKSVYAPAVRKETLPLFHLYPVCTLWLARCLWRFIQQKKSPNLSCLTILHGQNSTPPVKTKYFYTV